MYLTVSHLDTDPPSSAGEARGRKASCRKGQSRLFQYLILSSDHQVRCLRSSSLIKNNSECFAAKFSDSHRNFSENSPSTGSVFCPKVGAPWSWQGGPHGGHVPGVPRGLGGMEGDGAEQKGADTH